MQTLSNNQQVPVYALEPEETGNKYFGVYNFEGILPNQSDLLIPHRKDHHLIVFIRQAGRRQWIDMTPYALRENTIYFTGPTHIIVKEEFEKLWSTGIAYLTVLLTYLSRLYVEQYKDAEISADKLLLQQFQTKINESFRELHEVGDYAALLTISPGHLSEVVKSQSGKPAIKHIHERLVLEARRLLFHTHNSLKEIAFDLGFTDASYFGRFFKRETGLTPAEYRADIRKMYH